jgi:predicted PurR-regulated permease PerM
MAFFDRRTANVLLTILLFAVVLAIVYVARSVIVIFAFSILFAYLINPVVRFLQRHSLFFKNLRGPHVLEAYLALLILIALVIHGVAPGLLGQTGKLFKEVPAFMDGLLTGEAAVEMGSKYGWSDAQVLRLKSFLVQHRTDIQAYVQALERSVPGAIGGLVVIPILAIFFLSDGANLANSLIRLVSTKDNLEAIQSLADDLNVMLQHYIRAKVTLAGLSFIFYSSAMLGLGFPHSMAFGLLGGILEFIPVAGWMISATTIISVGVLTHSHWIWMAAFIGLWRMLMDYWIAPGVMGHELEIHPLLAIFTLMVGGAIGGIVGIYLSVPLVAALRVVWRRFASRALHHELTPAKLSAVRATD